MPKLNGTIVNVVRVGDSGAGRVVGESLKTLRELAGLTQAQMAKRLKIGKTAISKIERCGDIKISFLQRYIDALGAKLRIDAAFSEDTAVASWISQSLGHRISDGEQLVFPIFEDEHSRSQRDVILSVRPSYSEKIVRGEKTVELRRRFPLSAQPAIAYIYSTSPVRAIVGRADITDIVKLPITDIWKKYRGSASIEKAEFDAYFDGVSQGFALKFANARRLSRQINLSELRQRFGFEPPQSFLYATPVLRRALHDEYSNISD